jgi:hypothetical protein
MGHSQFSIQVLNYDGDPCGGVKVAVSGQGSYFQQEYTDSNGWANFEYEYLFDYNMDISVDINGDFVGDLSFSDGGTASFTIDWDT